MLYTYKYCFNPAIERQKLLGYVIMIRKICQKKASDFILRIPKETINDKRFCVKLI